MTLRLVISNYRTLYYWRFRLVILQLQTCPYASITPHTTVECREQITTLLTDLGCTLAEVSCCHVLCSDPTFSCDVEKCLVAGVFVFLFIISQQQNWLLSEIFCHCYTCCPTDCQEQSQVNTWVTEAGKVCSFLEAFTMCSLMVLMCSAPLPSTQKWSGEWSTCQENKNNGTGWYLCM